MAMQNQLKFNDPAPDVELLDAEAKPVKLSALWKEKPLVLSFTRHFGCPQCKEMVDQLIESHQSLLERGLALAIISHSTAEGTKQFCEQRAPGITCLADPDRAAYHAYGLYQGTFWQVCSRRASGHPTAGWRGRKASNPNCRPPARTRTRCRASSSSARTGESACRIAVQKSFFQ
jgi:peroxiredoxin